MKNQEHTLNRIDTIATINVPFFSSTALDKQSIQDVRKLSLDAFLIILATLAVASYPFVIAIGNTLLFFIVPALILVLLQRYSVHSLNKSSFSKMVRWTGYVLLMAACYYLSSRYGLSHPLSINGIVVLVGWLKFCDGHPYRDASGVIIIATVLFAESMISGYHYPGYLFLCILLILASLITVNNHQLRIISVLFISTLARMLLLALPLIAILYVFFPRVSSNIFPWQTNGVNSWFATQADSFKKSGQLENLNRTSKVSNSLSEKLSLDEFSELGHSNQLVFTATFEDKIPKLEHLYWRAGVFWGYDGRTWHQRPNWQRSDNTPQRYDASKPLTRYTVTLTPHQKRWLYSLETPIEYSEGSLLTRDKQLLSELKLTKSYQYQAVSSLNDNIHTQERLSNALRNRALQYPHGSNQRLNKLMAPLKGHPADKVSANILDYFAENNFKYDLNRFPAKGLDSFDDFVFNSKVGQCAHYAGAYVLAMRAAGVPARLITGFRGGQQSNNKQLNVTSMMAHAWAEYWTGRSWQRIDPTLAIPGQSMANIPATGRRFDDPISHPSQIEQPKMETGNYLFQLKSTVGEYFDIAMRYYNINLQKELLKFIGIGELRLRYMLLLSLGLALAFWLLLGRLLSLNKHKKENDPALQNYQQLQQKLALAGLNIDPTEGPEKYMQRARLVFPVQKDDIEEICKVVINARYAGHINKQEMRKVKYKIKQLN